MIGPRAQTAKRAHVDNLPLSLAQRGQRLPRDEKRSADVRRKDRVPLCESEFVECSRVVVRGIVNEDVETSELSCDGW